MKNETNSPAVRVEAEPEAEEALADLRNGFTDKAEQLLARLPSDPLPAPRQNDLTEILDRMEQRDSAAQCSCTPRERDSGHRVDCNTARSDVPALVKTLRRAEEVISEYCPADIAFGWEKESVKLLRETNRG